MPPQRIDFPFWPMVGAVALGTLIASAVLWVAVEYRIRWEVNAAVDALRDTSAVFEAESVKQRQAVQAAAAQARRDSQALAASSRDAREGKYMRAPDASIPAGELACLAGSIAKRESNGWQQQFDATGVTIKCRTKR